MRTEKQENKFWQEFQDLWKGESSYIMIQYTCINKADHKKMSGGFYRCNLTLEEGVQEFKKAVQHAAYYEATKIFFRDANGQAIIKIINNI